MCKSMRHLRIRCEIFFGKVTFLLLVLISITMQTTKADNSVLASGTPIISESGFGSAPLFAGKRNAVVMNQVCKLANGKQSFDEFNAFFSNKNISIAQLAIEDKGFASIAGNDISRMKTACAAYIATSVMIEPDEKEYMDQAANKPGTTGSTKSANHSVSKINPGKLTIALSKKMGSSTNKCICFCLNRNSIGKVRVWL